MVQAHGGKPHHSRTRVYVHRLVLLMVAFVALSYVRVQHYAVNNHLLDSTGAPGSRKLAQHTVGGGGGGQAPPVDALVSAISPVHGFVHKAGMTALANWHPAYAALRKASLKAWLAEKGSLLTGSSPAGLNLLGTKPPFVLHFHDGRGCNIYFNEKYRIIYLRTQKVASTTTMAFFGECDKEPDRPTCLTPLNLDDALQLQLMWNNFFVFGWSRNPWARAVSSYQYLLHAVRDQPECDVINWDSFCTDPMVFGDLCRLHPQCCPHFNHIFMYFHVNDQTTCLTTDSGEWAADFIGRSEKFDEDFPIILAEINRRLPPGVPPLSVAAKPASQNTNEERCSDEFVPRQRGGGGGGAAQQKRPATEAGAGQAQQQQAAAGATAGDAGTAAEQQAAAAAAAAAAQQAAAAAAAAQQAAAGTAAAATEQPAAITAAEQQQQGTTEAAAAGTAAAATTAAAAAAAQQAVGDAGQAQVQAADAAATAAQADAAAAAAAALAAAEQAAAAATAAATAEAAGADPGAGAAVAAAAAVQAAQEVAAEQVELHQAAAEELHAAAEGGARRLLYGRLPGFLFAEENYCQKQKFYSGRHAACFQQIARFYGTDIQRLGYAHLLHWDAPGEQPRRQGPEATE